MRCVLRAMRRLSRRALPTVLMLAVAPTAVLAQSLVCQAIRRGDTASHVAQRLTGNGRNKYQPWFQILTPSGSFVPKSQYDRLRHDWRACVIKQALDTSARKANYTAAAESSAATESSAGAESSAATEASEATGAVEVSSMVLDAPEVHATVDASGGRIDLTVIWLGAAVVVPWFGWRILDDYLDRRSRASLVMRRFADRFVHEFERPLIQQDAADRPIRVRVRSSRFGRRFDILLAPGTGRRYPNLSDHKQNVEYDVIRVLQRLADDSFVNGPLRAHAEWVVVPFRFNAGPKHTV